VCGRRFGADARNDRETRVLPIFLRISTLLRLIEPDVFSQAHHFAIPLLLVISALAFALVISLPAALTANARRRRRKSSVPEGEISSR